MAHFGWPGSSHMLRMDAMLRGCGVRVKYGRNLHITFQGINISHLGKRKIIFKMPFLGDMLVSWRVIGMNWWASVTAWVACKCWSVNIQFILGTRVMCVCVCVQSPNVSPSTKAQLKPIHLSARLFVVPRIKGSSICHFSTEGVGMLQKLSWSTDWKGSKTWEIASLPDMLHMYGCHLGVYWFSVCVCGHERYTRVERIFAMPLAWVAVEWSILIGVNSIDRALPHGTTVKRF